MKFNEQKFYRKWKTVSKISNVFAILGLIGTCISGILAITFIFWDVYAGIICAFSFVACVIVAIGGVACAWNADFKIFHYETRYTDIFR